MIGKNKPAVFIKIIFLCVITFLVNASNKKDGITVTISKYATNKYLAQEQEYLSKKLLIHEKLSSMSSFNLSTPENSHINLGFVGLKGFPLLHPYKIHGEKYDPKIHLVAELVCKYVKLPKCIKNLRSKIEHVKVVIMSAKWETETLYRPHYMLHLEEDFHLQLKTLLVCITGCDVDKQAHFSGKIAVNHYMVFPFATYLLPGKTFYGMNQFPAEPDNAGIIFPQVKNIGNIDNGSFWIVHKEEENAPVTATFFWIINNAHLKSELKEHILKPQQTWRNLMLALTDRKWGHPAKCLRKMSNL